MLLRAIRSADMCALQIRNYTNADDGNYSCIAHNDWGSSDPVHIFVQQNSKFYTKFDFSASKLKQQF